MNENVDKAAQTAARLGLEEAKVYALREAAIEQTRNTLNRSIEDQILGITNPAALQIQQADQALAEARRNAITYGGDLVNIEKLFGLQRQAILTQALTSVNSEQQAIADSLVRALQNIQKIRDSLALDSTLGGLNRLGRANEAQSQFNSLASRIAGGDATALDNVDSTTKAYLQASLDYYGPTAEYLSRLENVYQLLDSADTLARNSSSIQSQQLSAANQQVELLKQLNDKYAAASAAVTAQQGISATSLLKSGETGSALNAIDPITGLSLAVTRTAKASTGFNFSTATGTFADYVKAGNRSAGEQVLTALAASGASAGAIAAQKAAFGFATGTGGRSFSGGSAVVGENGPELLNFGQPVQIFSAGQTQALTSSVGLSEEFKAYRQQSEKETLYLAEQFGQLLHEFRELGVQLAAGARS
jgi:hypothetical protein